MYTQSLINYTSIQKQLDCFYQIISGRAGEKRNWEEFKQIFIPGALLSSAATKSNENSKSVIWNVDSYIQHLSLFLSANDFFERGYDYKIESTTNIAHVFSKYEARKTKDDSEILKRGINYIRLVKHEEVWKIVSMIWEDKNEKPKSFS